MRPTSKYARTKAKKKAKSNFIIEAFDEKSYMWWRGPYTKGSHYVAALRFAQEKCDVKTKKLVLYEVGPLPSGWWGRIGEEFVYDEKFIEEARKTAPHP